jgi:phage-related protein
MPDGRIDIDTKLDPKGAQEGFKELQKELGKTSKIFKDAQKEMQPYKKAINEAEAAMIELARANRTGAMSNKEFMEKVRELGAEHKKATDNMLKNNNALTASYIQQAAKYMNMTTHAEKMLGIYEKTNPALAKIAGSGLKAAAALERFANSGSAAQLALETLGAGATAKELSDFTKAINTNLAHVPVLVLAAAAAFGVLTAAIAKAARGPNPADIAKAQADAMLIYSEALEERAQQILGAWGLFEKVTRKASDPQVLLQNLRDQVAAIKDWSNNLQALAKRGLTDGMLQELYNMTPKAVEEVAALNRMTDEQLAEYVRLWKEKTNSAYSEAERQLIGLRKATEEEVKKLQESLRPLGVSIEKFKKTWGEALQPFVEVWGVIFAKVVDAATAVGQLIVKMNEVSPIFSVVIFSILYMATALFIVLTPLAIMGTYFGGLRAMAFAFLAPLKGLIAMFMTISSTALLVAAAIAIVVAAIWYLWNNNETFRTGIINAWNAIVAAAQAAWNWLYTGIIQPVVSAIWSFVKGILTQLRVFWQQNGNDILSATGKVFGLLWSIVQDALNFIMGLFKLVFPIMSAVVQTAWNIIKAIIQTLVSVFMNAVKMIAQLINGDFSGAMRSLGNIVRSIITGAVQVMGSFVSGVVNILGNLGASCYDGLAKIVGYFSDAGRKFMESLADGIRKGIKIVMGAMDDITNQIRNFLPFSPAKVGPLKDLDRLDFGDPIRLSIDKAQPKVNASMEHLFQLPQLQPLMSAVHGLLDSKGGLTVNQNVQFNNVENEAAFKRKLTQANRALAIEMQSI